MAGAPPILAARPLQVNDSRALWTLPRHCFVPPAQRPQHTAAPQRKHMSNNEENNAASATADAPASATAPATQQKPAQTSAPQRPQSRFYSRMGKAAGNSPKADTTESPAFAEGVAPEDAVLLRDNLPVRATVDPSLASGSTDETSDRPRRSDSDSGDRDRERGGRGRGGRDRDRDGNRGRGRDRDRDRDRGQDRERRPERSFEEEKPEIPGDESAPEAIEPVADETPEAEEEAPRQRLRFEEVDENPRSSSVQEFRPSREKQFAQDASRARKIKTDARVSKPEPQPKVSGGLFGWVKSIFTSDTNGSTSTADETTSDREDRGNRGNRGNRKRSRSGGKGSGPRSQSGQGRDPREGGSPDGQHRRRRRRGGRNRRGGGGGGGGGDHG